MTILKRVMSDAAGCGRRRRAALAAVLLAVGGCTGSLLESETPASLYYVLAPAPAAPGTAASVPVHLTIGRPDMAPGLDTERIAVLKGRQLDYYRTARWGGRSTEIVQSLLVASFEDQHLFRSVTAEQARVASDYVLDVTVRDFQAEYAGAAAPSAHVTFVARLIRVADRQLVGTFSSQAQRTAESNRMHAVAAAFEAAAHEVVLDIARQTAAAVTADAETLSRLRG